MFDKNILKNELLKFYKNLEIDKSSSIGWYYSDVVESEFIQKIETSNKKINKSYFKKNNKGKIKQDYFDIDLLNLLNEDDIENNWLKLKNLLNIIIQILYMIILYIQVIINTKYLMVYFRF